MNQCRKHFYLHSVRFRLIFKDIIIRFLSEFQFTNSNEKSQYGHILTAKSCRVSFSVVV